MADLNAHFAQDIQNFASVTLKDIKNRQKKDREELLALHDNQIQELESQRDNIPDAVLKQKRLELLNSQQVELGKLDREFSEEYKAAESAGRTEMEAKHAKARVEMSEKHYQV